MKTGTAIIATLAAALSLASAAEKIKAPNGGRVIDTVEPHAELLLTKDRKIEIRFLDDAGKVVAPADQVVTVVTGDRSSPTKLAFARDGDKLVSDKAVPEGDNLPVVVQIKSKEGEKAFTEKFNMNLSNCPTCVHAEYACTCDHAEENHEGHDHK